MDTINYIQILGYSAAILTIISFAYKPSHHFMRLINSFGCLLFIFFGVLLNNETKTNYGLPIVVANATILFINLVYYFITKNKSSQLPKDKNSVDNQSSHPVK